MVRGYQKRVVHLKNTESDAFDEAFFLVSAEGREMCEGELLREANRIVAECSSGKTKRRLKIGRLLCVALTHALMLLIGAVIGAMFVIL